MATKSIPKGYPPLSLQDIDNARQPMCGFYVITPLMAQVILEHRNPLNRPIKKTKLEQVIHDMEQGRFLLNGESVIFDSDGALLDGQHRLRSGVKTGVAFQSVVVLGIDPAVKHSLDQGAARTTGDVYQISGIPNGSLVAAICRLVAGYEATDGSSLGSVNRLSRAEVSDMLEKHKNIVAVGQWAMHYYGVARGITSSAVLGACRIILEERFGEEAVYYLERVAVGDNISVGDPAYAVRQRLMSLRGNPQQVEVILRGCIAHMEGRKLSRTILEGVLPRLPAKKPTKTNA